MNEAGGGGDDATVRVADLLGVKKYDVRAGGGVD